MITEDWKGGETVKLLSRKKLILVAVLPVVWLLGAGSAFGQAPANGTPEGRALELKDLLGSVEGTPREAPQIFKTKEGYLRFIGAPPSTHFAVAPGTPEEAAGAFVEEYRNLFVNVSPAVGFDVHRVNTHDSRSYVRYRQTYAGLEVFGAEVIVQVNAVGGIAAVMSDIMRDTEALDTGKISLNPSIDPFTAQEKAIEWLAAQHEQLEFEASDATLMVFDPPVVGWKGPTKLVWHIDVTNVGELRVQEFVLVDAHDGTIAFYYSRICYALNRQIYDYDGSEVAAEKVIDEEDLENYPYPTNPTIVDADRAYVYLGDAYEFYDVNHGRDGYKDDPLEPEIAMVRYTGDPHTAWFGDHMKIGPGWVTDDVVGHEFTHGVTFATSKLIYAATESGAISESFSDMWGEWIDQLYHHQDTTDEYKFPNATDDFSIALWVKRGTDDTLEYILDKRDATDDGWCLYFNADNTVGFSLDTIDITSSSTITDLNWHFIVVVIDRNGNGQIHIDNGSSEGSTSINSETMDISTDVLYMGRSSFEGSGYIYFNGYIDNVMICDKTLIPTEISDLYNNGDGTEPSYNFLQSIGCVGWWPMNNNSSIDHIVGDWSGKYNHGTAARYTSSLTADGVNSETTNSSLLFNGSSDYIYIDTTIGDNDSDEVKWLQGEDSVLGAIRNMKDPTLFEHPDRMSSEHWYEGDDLYYFTHRNNGVGNKLCYLLTDGSGDEPGGKFNGHTVWGMEIPKTADLFYECQTGMIPKACDYYDLYHVITYAAKTLEMTWEERVNIEEACQAVEIANDPLVHWWKFDDGSGTTAVDSVGDANGTLTNMDPETDWVTGKIGGALDFDGDNDYVSLPAIDALKGNTVTISAWINGYSIEEYSGGDHRYHPIVSTYYFENPDSFGYFLYVKDDETRFYLASGDGYYVGSSTIDNGWHHIAGTFDGSYLKIYVDGESKTSPDLSVYNLTGYYEEYNNTYIGYENEFDHHFEGIIDDVRVYNWAVDRDEILDKMFYGTSKFSIKNKSGVRVAWFDDLGNLFLKGTLEQGQGNDPQIQYNDGFRFKNSNGDDVAIIDGTNGNMYIKETLQLDSDGNWVAPTEGDGNFRIKDNGGNDVAYISKTGYLYLIGELYQQPAP